jgi:hypothetical protein
MLSQQRSDRFAAASGLISVVLLVLGGVIYGDGPKIGDDAGAITAFFIDSRSAVLWAMFVQGLGVVAMIWFMAALVVAMRANKERVLALATALAFVVALALGSAGTMMRGGLAFIVAGDVEPGAVAAIFHLGLILDTSQNVVSAGFFFPVALAILRTKFLPPWWGWASALIGLWAVVSTTAWNTSGFWTPDGGGFVNLVAYVAWVGVTSILLIGRMPPNPQ